MSPSGGLDPAQAYRTLAPAVLGYLRANRAPEPEDLLGEVFLQVARDRRRFRGDGDEDVRRWVFTIARHRLIDARRRQAARPVAPADPHAVAVVIDGPAPGSPGDGIDDELLAALDSLTVDQREILVLRFIADLSLDDVARLTGRKVNAVKQLQHRAIEGLRRCLVGGELDAARGTSGDAP